MTVEIESTTSADSGVLSGPMTPPRTERKVLLPADPSSPMVPEDMDELVHSDDEDDFVPLVNSSGMSFRRHAFEISIARDDEVDSEDGCFTCVGKVIASLLLASCLLTPFVYSYYTSEYHNETFRRPLSVTAAADQLECSRQLGISYSDLYRSIQINETGYCRTNNTEELNTQSCRCKNPTLPQKSIEEAVQRNQKLIEDHQNATVVFLGDSIMERFAGTVAGAPFPPASESVDAFQKLFGSFAFPLGVAGDRSNQLLHRIQNGEAPSSLEPDLWWVLIGTNDISILCNREAVLVGILAVLQELKQRKPTATIMINGILPRGHIPLDTSVIWQDIQWINERLECIGSLNRFGYFNASSIFLTGDKERVNETLMSDYLHPSGQGALLWAQAMSEELHKLQIRQQSAESER